MESDLDRESAKKSISARQSNDPEMEDALDSASKFQLEIVKEQHRHLESQRMSDLGFFGRFLGGEKRAHLRGANSDDGRTFGRRCSNVHGGKGSFRL